MSCMIIQYVITLLFITPTRALQGDMYASGAKSLPLDEWASDTQTLNAWAAAKAIMSVPSAMATFTRTAVSSDTSYM